MIQATFRWALFLAIGVVANNSFGAIVVFNGELTAGDLTFNRPSSATTLSGVGTTVAYDTFTFVSDAVGPYSVSGDYSAGGVGSNDGLDGFVYLYSPAFLPAAGLSNLIAADDDHDADGGGPLSNFDGSLIPSVGSFGVGTTATTLTLTPGQSYTLVVSGFDNSDVAGGLGPYAITVTGVVPEPSACFGLVVLGIVFGFYRRP